VQGEVAGLAEHYGGGDGEGGGVVAPDPAVGPDDGEPGGCLAGAEPDVQAGRGVQAVHELAGGGVCEHLGGGARGPADGQQLQEGDAVGELDRLASRHGYQVTYSVGWELGAREKAAIGQVPEIAWQIAVDGKGEARERRADGACPGRDCGHRRCWIEEAHVTELTGLLREGPAGGRRRCLKIAVTWPWAQDIVAAWHRVHAISHPT
jgi:hypothetical protein